MSMSSSEKEKELRKSIETYIDWHVMVPEVQQSNWLSWKLCRRSKPQEAQSAKEENHDEEKPQAQAPDPEPVHLLDHLRTRMLHGSVYSHDRPVPITNRHRQDVQEWQTYRNIQELKTAGIHLKRGKNCYLSKIKFTKQFLFRGQLQDRKSVV